MSKKYKMKTPKFIEITAETNGELIKVTLNINNIDGYVSHIKNGTENGIETQCCITVSPFRGVESYFLYVMETKEYLDKILT